ncbi:YutD family protein [Cohnella faecalis]|uniref:DUF1027 domain-containing protein n=1 Tax=Cohnella faecalis TaxID=2315694 RepID=A0A398CVZ8_9BACL|nr:YutD family protein [Cohnella faecalis]RIE03194.1 DUF1027 domain-containing protein [Cohnella faecalis]
MAGGNAYELVHEHKTAWNPEAFRERFSEVLERYDYIVGDWGYNQLRLKGFFKEGHSRSTKDSTIASLVDYINEYCNFGCAYFVLTKLDATALPPGTELTDLESAAASAAASEGAEPQAAEAAVAPTTGGILMRWPLKERPGGPVRTPSMSAVARAVAESAERRNANAGSQSGGRSSSDGRQSGYGGGNRQDGGNRQGGRSNGSYYQGQGDRRQGGGGGGGGQTSGGAGEGRGGKPSYQQQQRERGPRQQGGDRNVSSGGQPRPQQQERAVVEPPRAGEAAVGAPRGDAAKSGGGGRWGPSGKNRRRQRYGGKPNHQESSHSPEPGKPGGE